MFHHVWGGAGFARGGRCYQHLPPFFLDSHLSAGSQRPFHQPDDHFLPPVSGQATVFAAVPFPDQGIELVLCRAACRPVHGHAGRLHIHQGQKGAALGFVDAHGVPLSAKGQHGPCRRFQGPQIVVQRAGAVLHALEGIQARAPGRAVHVLRGADGWQRLAGQQEQGFLVAVDLADVLPDGGKMAFGVICRGGGGGRQGRNRSRSGQRVDPGLHPRQRVRYPLLRQLLDVGEVEGGLELVPADGEGQAGDLRPRAHQRPQGLAVFGGGRREGEGAGEVHDVLGDVAVGFLLPGQLLFHAVEGFDVGQLHGQGLLAGVAHDQQHEAVAVEDEHGARLALLVRIFGRRKIALAEVFWAVTGYIAYVAENIGMPLAKKLGNFKRRGGRAAGVERDGRGKCFGNELGL